MVAKDQFFDRIDGGRRVEIDVRRRLPFKIDQSWNENEKLYWQGDLPPVVG